MAPNEAQSDRRDSLRVHSGAALSYEVLPPDRVQREADEIRSSVPEAADDLSQLERLWHGEDDVWEKVDAEFSRIGNQVAEVNAKLDYLIALAEGTTKAKNIKRFREVQDLSGTGLSFADDREVPVGSVLRLSIELSRFPRLVVNCLGEVARSDPAGNGENGPYTVGVQYSVINEEDRERIIRHTFRIQRRFLRSRRADSEHD